MARSYDFYRYNKNLKKVFKPGKTRLFCHVAEDGTVYMCNSYAVYQLSPTEYREFVQPSTCCEPGHWCIEDTGEKHEIPATDFDFIKMFQDAVSDTAPRSTVYRAPFTLPGQTKQTVAGFYSKDADFVTVLNDAYIGVFDEGMKYETSSNLMPVLVYWGDMPISMVLPIRWTSGASLLRAVRAYFVAGDEQSEKSNLAAENERMHSTIIEQEVEIARLKQQLAELERTDATNERLGETVSNQDAIISRQDARIAELETQFAEAQQGRETSPALKPAAEGTSAEERRAALDRLNHAQNAANAFYNISEDEIAAEIDRAKNAAEPPQNTITAFLPAFRTFTAQTGPQTLTMLEHRCRQRSHRLIMRGGVAA